MVMGCPCREEEEDEEDESEGEDPAVDSLAAAIRIQVSWCQQVVHIVGFLVPLPLSITFIYLDF